MISKAFTHKVESILLILLLFVSVDTVAKEANQIPDACRNECVTDYGKIVGVSKRGVKAYSNCNSNCVIFEPNTWNEVYTGIKWQCVEYARRWLLINKGAVYGDVDTAADIWKNIHYLTEVKTSKSLPLKSYLNGSRQAPRVGDLLIYSKEFNNTGHVAVVIDVDYENSLVEVGEQNFRNEKWPDNFARKIEYVKKGGSYWLLDAYLLGWKQLASAPHE